MTSVNFFNEDIPFTLADQSTTKKWVNTVIIKEGYQLHELNFIFCSDQYLHQMNVDYLRHDTFTDIITFDHSEEEGHLEGDIFISIDRVKDNAEQLRVLFEDELHRVIIHGVLHLIGYDDKTSKEKTEMRKKEEAYLSLRH